MTTKVRNWSLDDLKTISVPDSIVSEYGTICVFMKRAILELTVQSGLHLTSKNNYTKIAMSKNGGAVAMAHPMGHIFGYNSIVELDMEHFRGNRHVKINGEKLTFTMEGHPMTYALTNYGVKTSADTFNKLNAEFINKTLYYDSTWGTSCVDNAYDILYKSKFWVTNWGQKNWNISNIRIVETPEGHVKVYKFNNTCILKMNCDLETVLIQTPMIHCTASFGLQPHVYFRTVNYSMHYNGQVLTVRNGKKNACINDENVLIVN